MIRALVVDDEELARNRLKRLLRAERDVVVVGESATGSAAVAAIHELAPDVVLLDVQMPDGGGFDVVEWIGSEVMPHVIFVTAFSEHAVQAFAADALDYLVKPVSGERLAEAIARARKQLALEAGGAPRRVERIVARAGPRLRLISVDDIDYVTADGNYVQLHVGQSAYLVRESLSGLETRLDPDRFLRIHRGTLVRIDRVEEVEPLFQGEYLLLLRGGAKLTSGRSYRAKLQQALGLKA